MQLDQAYNLFALHDGTVATDAGHAIFVQYVDIAPMKRTARPRSLVKAIEAEYGLEYSPTIRISAPRRFREFGETFIRDDQEGQAQHQVTEKTVSKGTEDRLAEQQRALSALGQHGVTISRSAGTNTQTQTQTHTFGKSAWIYCTSILPPPEKRDAWREHLPESYDHETIIRQPTKFAQALGTMLADQIGPQGKQATLTHSDGRQSVHDSQMIFHGPVLYTDDVLGFLSARKTDLLHWMYPLFVKDIRYAAQREYRFVAHCERPVEQPHLDLRVSGMMRDALAPIHFASPVEFRAEADVRKKSASQTTTGPTPKTKTTTRTRRTNDRRRWTVKAGDVVQREELIDREQIISLTTESTLDGNEGVQDTEEPASRSAAKITETEVRKLEVGGTLAETSKILRTRIGYIATTEGADDLFSLEERQEAESVLEAARQPFRDFANLPVGAADVLVSLIEEAGDLEPEAEVHLMSACWNSIWAICNLCKCFGDIVERVAIEQEEFVAVVLKPSTGLQAQGTLLVGPRGTYAYVVRRGDDERYGYGGEDTRLFVFPDEKTRSTFEEFGWSAGVEGQRSAVTSPT